MNTLSEQVKGIMAQLGKAFLISGYLPAAILVFVHQVLLFPRWTGKPLNLFGSGILPAGEAQEALNSLPVLISEALTWLVLPLLVGMLLLALNSFIISFFEGKYAWQRQTYLEGALKRNRERSQALYGELLALKQRYSQALVTMDTAEVEGEEWQQVKLRVDHLPAEIQELHKQIEEEGLVQTLPIRPELVTPTALGNAWAVLEEYPYDRYGMDAMIYWPRLRGEVDEAFDARLTNQKTLIDFLLNTSFLALIFGLEILITGLLALSQDLAVEWPWLLGGVLGAAFSWGVAYLAYQAAVGNTRGLGQMTNMCWDFFRHKLAAKYQLTVPKTLLEEQKMWLRLASFLRRGEAFYFPAEYASSAQKEEKKEG